MFVLNFIIVLLANFGIASVFAFHLYTSCVNRGDVALTYDDGVSHYTQELLEILKSYKIKATFFVLGQNLMYHEKRTEHRHILKRMYDEGHVIASHSFNHPDLTTLGYDGLYYQVHETGSIIKNLIGKRPKFFRPPYGAYNDWVLEFLDDNGYKTVMWNVDTNDWRYVGDPYSIMQQIYYGMSYDLSPKIILMHDIFRTTIDTQREIIDYIKNLGYNFVTMDKCLETSAYE